METEIMTGKNNEQMADISDHIAEAYFGEMGELMRENSRKRIDWICEQVNGIRVLDIGCSQGITEILLGRKGIHVLGIDIAPKAIQYAETMAASEPPDVQQCMRFLCSDFLTTDLPDKDFDTVILSEILEYLEDPEEMLKKVISCLRTDGLVIVTVPFGINDFPDHKQTFYVLGILEILQKYAKIEVVEFFCSWIGFVAIKQTTEDHETAQQISYSLLRKEEEAFFMLERELRDTEKNLKARLAETADNARKKLADEKERTSVALERAIELEMKFTQLEFQLQCFEEDSYNLQSNLTQRIITAEKNLREATKQAQNAERKLTSTEDKLKSTEKKLKNTEKKLKNTEKKLKEKTLPPIWYMMAESRAGGTLCKLFSWYHGSKRIFRIWKNESNRNE